MNLMSQGTRKNQAADKAQDWAVIPFDEAEDEARWEKLIDETDDLIAEAKQLETALGAPLTKNKIKDIKTSEKQSEDELF